MNTFHNPRPPVLDVSAEAWMDTRALVSAVDVAMILLGEPDPSVEQLCSLRDLLRERVLPVRAMLDRQEIAARRYMRRAAQ